MSGNTQPNQWKVGELSRRTGVSVRTLHHYEEIGLLVPSRRTESGHRLYGRNEIIRLQQIVSLRQIGFSLEEIGECLNRREFSPLKVIEMHASKIREQIGLQEKLVTRLDAIGAALRATEEVSVNEFIRTIEAITMFEKYYTPEQLEQLRNRRQLVGETRMAEVEQEWREIFRLYREEMDNGTDPSHERVQELARRSAGLIEEFTGGDPGIYESLSNLYKNEPTAGEQFGFDSAPGLREYMGRAARAVKKGQG